MIKKKKNRKLRGFFMNDKTGHVSKPFRQKLNTVFSLGFTHNKEDKVPKEKLKHNIDPSDDRECYVKKKVEVQDYRDYKYKKKYIDYRIQEEDKSIIERLEGKNKKRRW